MMNDQFYMAFSTAEQQLAALFVFGFGVSFIIGLFCITGWLIFIGLGYLLFPEWMKKNRTSSTGPR